MTDPRATAAAARIHERAPDLADEPTERLVHDYLDAAEPHDLATLSADDVAGAVIAILRLGRDRPPGGRVVAVANPSAARDGWDSPHTAVDVVTDDAPFLVDSVSAALVRRGYDLHLLLHPLLEHPGVGTTSHLHVEIDRETDPVVLAALDLEVRSVVDDVFAAVEDWDAMRERVAELARGLEERPPPHADPADVAEVATYLAWLADDHFTFVGRGRGGRRRRRRARLRARGGACGARCSASTNPPTPPTVGCCRSPSRCNTPPSTAPCPSTRSTSAASGLTTPRWVRPASSASTPRTSTASRPRRSRCCAARSRRSWRGRASGLRAMTGASSPTCWRPTHATSCSGSTPGSWPTLALGIVAMGLRRRVRLFVSRDQRGCFVSCLVYLPRDRYTTIARIQVVDALRRAFDGSEVDFTVLLTESVMARLHVVVSTPDGAPPVDALALEAELAALVRAWVDDLHDAFVEARGEEAGVESYRHWMRAFPAAYQFEVDADVAVADVAVLETLDPGGDLEIRLEPPVGGVARIKLYRTGGALVLSDVMPLLEHLGVTVVDERPYEIDAPDGIARWIYSFGVRDEVGDPLGDPAVQARVADVFLGVWAGTIENDELNRLVLRAGLSARDVVIVRALCQYLRQAGVRFTDAYLADTLAANPEPVRLIVAWFHQRLDPDAAARSGRRGRRRRRARRGDRRGGQPRCRPDPAGARARRGGGGADERVPERGRTWRASSTRRRSTSCPGPGRSTRSGWRPPRWRASTCAPATSRAAASAGPTGGRTSAPRSSV